MFKLTKIQRPWLALAAIGALGLAAYGVFHTASALADSGDPLPADQTVVNSASQGNAKPDGAFCNPYGCAGCNGCVSLQYQQNIAETSGAVADLQTE
jgi:hypothetical protein